MAPTAAEPQDGPSIATPWGVESLSPEQRYIKGVKAGLDQFGGVEEPRYLVDAVTGGDLSEERLGESVKRIMTAKFELGLFDNPYVDTADAGRIVGSREFIDLGARAQRRAQVLLENKNDFLPVAAEGKKVFLFGMAPAAAEAAGLRVVADPADADFAIIRTETPNEVLHPHHFFGSRQDEGRLDFRAGDEAWEILIKASTQVPTVVAIFLDRPAVLGNVRDKATAIVGNFGASDAAILDVVLGVEKPEGKLPFELPSSMAAVEAQHPAVADDSEKPLYPNGYGMAFK
jgi:beta-glucosidase